MNSDATRFEWSVPEIVRVKDYCRQRLGWTEVEIDKTVVPAIANFAANQAQRRIDSYYLSYNDNIQFARIRSNRLRAAVSNITGQVPEPSARLTVLPEKLTNKKRSKTAADEESQSPKQARKQSRKQQQSKTGKK